jgi:hypothetical protein
MTKGWVRDLESFVEEASEHPDDREGIAKDLVDYVKELLADREDLSYLKGARDAQRAFFRGTGREGSDEG